MTKAIIKVNEIISSEDKTDAQKLAEVKQFVDILKNKQQSTIDWQLVAGYLDQQIFEFFLRNQNDEKIKEFATTLAGNLAEKFGLVRDTTTMTRPN
jgi:hypothetical protein